MSRATGTLTGRLLVAAPSLADPHFVRTVVLLLDHGDDGALGVVLNRPSDVPVGEVLPGWDAVASTPGVLFHGGPVGADAALGVVAASGAEVLGVRRVAPGLGVVDLDAPPEVVGPAVRGLRVFAGYAGWSADQLEAEIEEGAWYVVQGLPSDVTRPQPAGLWRDVLRRQGGALAFVSTYPGGAADPTYN